MMRMMPLLSAPPLSLSLSLSQKLLVTAAGWLQGYEIDLEFTN